jgi:hypothetical protein
MDNGVAWLKKNNLALTRKNWLQLNYLGDVPELDGELEAEIPTEDLVDEPSNVILIDRRKDAGVSLTEALIVLALLLVLGGLAAPTLLDALHTAKDLLAMASQVVVR